MPVAMTPGLAEFSRKARAAEVEAMNTVLPKEQETQRLRSLLLEGAGSVPASPADRAYFDGLRDRVRQSTRLDTA